MLQQTQVARVLPKYEAFLARLPTPAACASTSVGEVVRLWAGLGYNRRAVNLHRCAQQVVDEHGGRLPDELGALQALPGIGPYTARAVLAFAFERDVGVLDTNAARVHARRAGRPLKAKEAQELADAAVPAGQGWAWNQAMLDLGATVCRARTAACAECPVTLGCTWFEAGGATEDPAGGSAFVSGPQSTFAGSDREGRGRLVHALRAGVVPRSEAAAVAGWPDDPERAERIVVGLLGDGLVEEAGQDLCLPGGSP
jgi:A/G-specific adenine glycosylase